jgi:hypothetical protein
LHCRPDIPIEVYHADRSCVSSTGLKEILRSPAHYQAYLTSERKETPALFLGTAIHAKLLEPALFDETYVIAPVGDKRAKEYKEFEIANANKKILTPEQAEIIEGIATSVSMHTSASALLRAGLVEHSIIWQDEETGIWLKIRPDCLCVDFDTGICLDVKSTDDASHGAFLRSCINYNYDLSAALYVEGLRNTFRRDFDFCFLATEKNKPYGVALYGASEDMLSRGERRVRQALRLLKQCRDNDEWPCYQPDGGYEVLEWPRWAA